MEGGMLLEVNGPGSTITVENQQYGTVPGDLPSLPITGAAGTVLLLGGGAILLIVGGTMMVLRKRSTSVNE